MYKGGRTSPAGPVLVKLLFQAGSKYISANQNSNACLRIGLRYES